MPPPSSPINDRAAADALATAANLPDDAETQVVLFSGRHVARFSARRLNPTESLADDFRDVARRFAAGVASKRSPVGYNPGRTPSSYEIAYLPVGEVAGLRDVLNDVEGSVGIELFEPNSREARELRFYIVAFRTENPSWIHFFRSKGETLRLKRTKKIVAVMSGAAYDELEADPLVFDTNFDAIIANGVTLVINQDAFARSLGFVEQARQLARETLAQLSERIAISNAEQFLAAAASDLNMVAKVRSIAAKIARDPAYADAMTTERVIAFAEENDIEIDVEEIDGKKHFVFHPEPRRRWRILRLLDDDYLHSQLTELDYEVNSKSPLNA